MSKILVWDLPARLFHWTFAGSLSGALAIGFWVDDDSPLFQLHMLLGLVAAFALAARLVLGVLGSRYNRFSALPLRPREVVAYFVGSILGGAKRYIGHNPGAALASLAMFALVPLLIATGAGWLGGVGEEIHEGLAIALLVAIGGLLAGLAWHTVRHREAIAFSMVTGRKEGPEEAGLKTARPVWALALVVGGAAWVAALFANHDAAAATVKLPLLGTVIALGENQGGDGGEGGERGKRGEEGERGDN
jgi:cytochrome b